jgi:hypothetical protein
VVVVTLAKVELVIVDTKPEETVLHGSHVVDIVSCYENRMILWHNTARGQNGRIEVKVERGHPGSIHFVGGKGAAAHLAQIHGTLGLMAHPYTRVIDELESLVRSGSRCSSWGALMSSCGRVGLAKLRPPQWTSTYAPLIQAYWSITPGLVLV